MKKARTKKQPRKPTGRITQSSLHISKIDGVELRQLGEFKLPEEKNLAETVVMEKFVQVSRQAPFIQAVNSCSKFPTDHGPDFSIVVENIGDAFAELVEIAPLKYENYENASRVRNLGEYVDHVINEVLKKEAKYKNRDFVPLYLIIYVSDDKFLPDPHQTCLIMQSVNLLKLTAFNEIYLILFAYDGNATVAKIWPDPRRPLNLQQIAEMRDQQMIRVDQSKIVIMSEAWHGNEFDVTTRIYFPKGTDMTKFAELAKTPDRALKPGDLPSGIVPDVRLGRFKKDQGKS